MLLSGSYLRAIQLAQDGSQSFPPGFINIQRQQKICEIVREVKQWQRVAYNLRPVPEILAFIERSLDHFDGVKWPNEWDWQTSLLREPREREDVKLGSVGEA